jgi:hypothetical protein
MDGVPGKAARVVATVFFPVVTVYLDDLVRLALSISDFFEIACGVGAELVATLVH